MLLLPAYTPLKPSVLPPVHPASVASQIRHCTRHQCKQLLDCRLVKHVPNQQRARLGQRRGTHTAMAAQPDAATASQDLLIVGPGVLGSYLGKLWRERHPSAEVVGQTNTTANHERLRALGIAPRTKAQADGRRFPFVAFTAPPSGSEDYVAEIRAALDRWDGSGAFAFTGSAGVYAEDGGGPCPEDGPVVAVGHSERTDRLLAAEGAVLGAGGCVVRLAGLYHGGRGAHTFFLKAGRVERWGGYTVNLLHYEDAARLTEAVLSGRDERGEPHRARVFLGCDDAPVTFQEMMDAATASGAFKGSVEFVGAPGPSRGKRLDNAATRGALGWAPRHPSFAEFAAAGARDFFTAQQPELAVQGAAHSS